MRLARHDGHRRLGIVPRSSPPQQRQQHKHHQQVGNDIRRDLHLIALGHLGRIQTEQGRIGQQHVQPLQLRVGAAAKGAHAVEGAEVERPDLDHGGGLRLGLLGLLDGGFGGFAALGAPAGEDHAGGAEADKVAGCFEPEAAVGAGDDDGASGIGGGGDGEGAELALEEVAGQGEAGCSVSGGE